VTSVVLILFFGLHRTCEHPGDGRQDHGDGPRRWHFIDATILRALLVPTLVSMSGRWTWWLLSWAARLLRVEPSPVASNEAVDKGCGEPRMNPNEPPKPTFWSMPLQPVQQ